MRYDTIADVFSANEAIRHQLLEFLTGVSDREAEEVPDGEKWSIKQIVEHLAIVDHDVSRICRKLLAEAREAGKLADGKIPISQEFWERSSEISHEKVDAPAQAQPTGSVAVSESVDRIRRNRNNFDSLLSDLETYDMADFKFPHPYFGQINAVEWLVMAGGHELRHLRQIERHLERIRHKKSPGQKEGDPTGVKTPN